MLLAAPWLFFLSRATFVTLYDTLPGGYECNLQNFVVFHDKILGTGGEAIIFLSRHIKTRQVYALKRHRVQENFSDQLDRLKKQEELQHRFDSPHVCRHYCSFLDGQTVYQVFEYVKGMSLKQKLIMRAEWPTHDQLILIAFQLFRVIEHIHLNHVVHNDIHVENILIDESGKVKLIDFGGAMELDPSYYRPPEWRNYNYLPKYAPSPYADWFALGMLIYLMLKWEFCKSRPSVSCMWLAPRLLKMEHCNMTVGSSACELIMGLSGHTSDMDWENTWGLTSETLDKLRNHSLFKSIS